jgi:hypothetical protein
MRGVYMKALKVYKLSSKGFVSRKYNHFDKLNVAIWFTQLLISFVVALS